MVTDKQDKKTAKSSSEQLTNKDSRNRDQKRQPFKARKFNENQDDFTEEVVQVRRITKVTKGGRRFRFACVVVVGDKKGQVGFGTGKANEVPTAIKKAAKNARRVLVNVPIINGTVPHEVTGKFGAGLVLIKPARAGSGVIAGGPARVVVELAGLHNVYTKSLGSKTPINMIRATLSGLQSLRTIQETASLRDKTVAQIKG